MPDLSREAFKASLKQPWLKRRLRAGFKRWRGANNPEIREAWIEKTLTELPAGWRVLDAGAGELQYKRFCEHLDYVSQDFGRYEGTGDGAALQPGSWNTSGIDIVSDITAIPEPDGSFDAVMCVEVLEHLPAPIEALEEFARLLRPGGVLIVTAPFASLTHFSPYHFYSGFNRNFYATWLKEFGFEIVELVPNGNFFEFLIQELLRVRTIARRYGRRRKRLSLVEYLALAIMVRALKRLSRDDAGSSELLCYGYMVKAVKSADPSAEQPPAAQASR